MTPDRPPTVLAAATGAVAVVLLAGLALAAPGSPDDLPGVPQVGDRAWWAGLLLVALQALALTRLHRHPTTVLVAVAAAAPVGAAAGLGAAIGTTSVAVLVASYVVVVRRDAPTGPAQSQGVWPALGAAVLLVAGAQLVVEVRDGADPLAASASALLQGLATVGVAAGIGLVVASRRATRTAQEERALARAGEQAALVDAAVARERTAMARELHDIAAHHLTGIAVMSAAIGRQIDVDPDGAKEAVRVVREQTTAMLRDMRGLVGLLREADRPEAGSDDVVREEDLDGIARLVAESAARGEDVGLEVVGPVGADPRDGIGPLARLSTYRTVREALTNAARHAPGLPCRVLVDASDPAGVRVTVDNEVAPGRPAGVLPGGGFGLVGMRERAGLTGARLTVGPGGRGWLVDLQLPVQEEAR